MRQYNSTITLITEVGNDSRLLEMTILEKFQRLKSRYAPDEVMC
ncbi:MAG: hypothetical protein JWN28_587 [Candidatus Saccharibacteria bacterium]|nr:hypothetical protein [Candidatus Saccharibacteria bacterium]